MVLVLVAGLPGTGKSRIGKAFGKKGFVCLSRDDVIKKLFDPVDYSSNSQKEMAFAEMLKLAESDLILSRDVVLDVPFSHKSEVDSAFGLAIKVGVSIKIIYCFCSDDLAVKRIISQKHEATDRNQDLYFDVKRRFESIDRPHLTVDTGRPFEQVFADCVSYVDN